jgi:hypothetical protein
MRQPPDMSLVGLWIIICVNPRAWRSSDGPGLEGVGIDLVEPLVDGLQALVLGAKVFHDVLLKLLKALHLVR